MLIAVVYSYSGYPTVFVESVYNAYRNGVLKVGNTLIGVHSLTPKNWVLD